MGPIFYSYSLTIADASGTRADGAYQERSLLGVLL